MQAESIYAMDFFTVDTLLNQRFYVLFIIHHSTREIVQFAVTQNPVREFVRQQIIELENSLDSIIYLIRDHSYNHQDNQDKTHLLKEEPL